MSESDSKISDNLAYETLKDLESFKIYFQGNAKILGNCKLLGWGKDGFLLVSSGYPDTCLVPVSAIAYIVVEEGEPPEAAYIPFSR